MATLADYTRREIPDWLYMAHVENENITIADGDVTWNAGTFSGVWEDGVWNGGTFENGTWVNGVFNDGTFENGLWKNGTINGGTILDGIFEIVSALGQANITNGVFESITSIVDSEFLGGIIKHCTSAKNSIFENITWHDGNSEECRFFNSTWLNGMTKQSIFEFCTWHDGWVDTATESTSTFNGVTWLDGTWYGKKFDAGVWHSGLFSSKKKAELTNSLWKDGSFIAPLTTVKCCTWEAGFVYNCEEFINCRWKNGTWNTPADKRFSSDKNLQASGEYGYSGKAVWENGTWMDGTFGPSKGRTNKSWILGPEYVNETPNELEPVCLEKKIPSTCIWENGLFRKGTMENCHWYSGQVQKDGDKKTLTKFTNVIWLDGKVYRSNMIDVVWVEGTFGIITGAMSDSHWLGGIFLHGNTNGMNFYGGRFEGTWLGGTFWDGQFSQSATWISGDYRGTAYHKGVIVKAPDTPFNVD
jgi:hypothetical protein